jgi:hypothetical protein
LLAAVDVQTLHPPVVALLRQFHESPA